MVEDINELEKHTLCAQAIGLWGYNSQVLMVIEELSELIFTLCKFERGQKNTAAIADEIADCRIMFKQLMHLTGITEEDITIHEKAKWERIKDRIQQEKDKKHGR